MEKVIELLNRMQADGVIEKFALGGGIAAIYYLEPHSIEGIDVFLSSVILDQFGLVPFGDVDAYLEKQGYQAEGDYIRIEDWLVQFLPASQPVQKEAVEQALRVPYGSSSTLIFSAEHLAAEFLRSGRLKDTLGLIALLQSEAMDGKIFRDIIHRHGLTEKWNTFAARCDIKE
jgi:hypothetical protein